MIKKILIMFVLQVFTGLFAFVSYSDQWDPADDLIASAVNLPTPGSLEITHGPHTLSPVDTADWFSVLLDRGTLYEFFTSGDADTKADFYIADENTLILSEDAGGTGNNFHFSFTPLVSEMFFLKIQLAKAGDSGSYILHVVNVSEGSAPTDDWDPADNTYTGATQLMPASLNNQEHGAHFLSAKDHFDWFAISLNAGTPYVFSSSGKLDTEINLYDKDGVSRLASNDNTLSDLNFLLYFTPDKTQSYYLRISQKDANVAGEYFLHYQISNSPPPQGDPWDPKDDIIEGATLIGMPTDTEQLHGPHVLTDYDRNDWYMIDLEAQAEYQFRFTGEKSLDLDIFDTDRTSLLVYDVNIEQKNDFSVKFVPGKSGKYYLRVFKKSTGNAAYTFFFRQTSTMPKPVLDSWDPKDDTAPGATVLGSPLGSDNTHGPHTLSLGDRYDWFSFQLSQGVSYTFWTSGNSDTFAELYSEDGKTLLAEKDAGGAGYNFNLIFTPAIDGQYTLRVRLYDTGAQGDYVLHYQIKQPDPVGEDEWDPADNTFENATKIGEPPLLVKAHGPHVLSQSDPADWFELTLEKGKIYECTTLGDSDTIGTLYLPDGMTPIVMDDDGGAKRNFRITYLPLESKSYYLQITEKSGKNAVYTLYCRGEVFTAVNSWMMY